MPTTMLNLTDLDNRIRDLEHKYEMTSVEMLANHELRARISEDVLLKWETYLRQRLYLREESDEKRCRYLEQLDQPHDEQSTRSAKADELSLAA